MALFPWTLTLICSLLFQAVIPSPAAGPDGLLDVERSRLEKETKLDNRIKIYEAASIRCQNSLSGMIQSQELQRVPSQLKSWLSLLETSLKDVEQTPSRKDKSHALIRYEIHLRKAISNLQELKLKASVDEFDDFEAWLARAEEIRKKFVNMLFQL